MILYNPLMLQSMDPRKLTVEQRRQVLYSLEHMLAISDDEVMNKKAFDNYVYWKSKIKSPMTVSIAAPAVVR